MASKSNEQVVTETFSERSPFADGMTAAGASAGAGLFVSAIQNSVQSHNKGALGVFTRTGSTIALFSKYLHPLRRGTDLCREEAHAYCGCARCTWLTRLQSLLSYNVPLTNAVLYLVTLHR